MQGAGYADHNDWRVPNFKELQTLVEYQCLLPSINESAFPGTSTSNYYWSSSPTASNTDQVWAVSFFNGYDSSQLRTALSLLRLVRTFQD